MVDIYSYVLHDRNGETIELERFRGKVLLIVNTATGCGFTPQYKELEQMYEKYHDKGFEIIDIPCNQFGGQAPGTDEEIHEFCTLRYKTQFPQMKKAEVNGPDELPIYTYMKSIKGFEGFGKGPKALAMHAMLKLKDKNYDKNPDIKWNFTKFLINGEGHVIARFEPTEDMEKVDEAISKLL